MTLSGKQQGKLWVLSWHPQRPISRVVHQLPLLGHQRGIPLGRSIARQPISPSYLQNVRLFSLGVHCYPNLTFSLSISLSLSLSLFPSSDGAKREMRTVISKSFVTFLRSLPPILRENEKLEVLLHAALKLLQNTKVSHLISSQLYTDTR